MNFGKSSQSAMEPQTQVTFGDVAGPSRWRMKSDFLTTALQQWGQFPWCCWWGHRELVKHWLVPPEASTLPSISGSEFVEMFVGVGASVRDLFEQERQMLPVLCSSMKLTLLVVSEVLA